MKKLFRRPHKIVFTIILFLILLSMVIYFLPSYFSMKVDNDTGCYSIYPSGRHSMSYCDGELIVQNFEHNFTDIYSIDGKKQMSTPQISQIIKNRMIFLVQDKLYYKTLDSNNQLLIKDICSCFVFDGKNVVFESEDDLYVFEITSDQKANNKKIHTFNKDENICFLQLIENKLYVATFLEHQDFLRKYNFYIFNIDTMSMVDSCYCTMSGSSHDMSICNGSFIFNHDSSSSIFKVDFENNDLIKLLEHDNIVALTSNGNKVYFASEKTKWELITHTIDVETNGLWELDITTGNVNKISDQCVIDDLLATNNYVYCYTIDYTFPRGVSNSNIKGYKLQQIPIN